MVEHATLTDLILRAQQGDEAAFEAFFAITYADLRRMARTRLNKSLRGPLLDTTSLVHESYLRFSGAGQLRIEDRAHFFRYAGQVMRSVIVDLARAQLTARRGSGAAHVPLDANLPGSAPNGAEQILRLHEALDELREYDERMVRVVEMRYFGGMSDAAIAESLGITDRTVRRDWQKARLLLAQAML